MLWYHWLLIRYRYIVCQGSELLRWETLPQQRTVKPQGKSFSVDDGNFGQKKAGKDFQVEEFVEEGWLIGRSQLRFRFWSEFGEAVLYDTNIKVTYFYWKIRSEILQNFRMSVYTQEPLSKVSVLTVWLNLEYQPSFRSHNWPFRYLRSFRTRLYSLDRMYRLWQQWL